MKTMCVRVLMMLQIKLKLEVRRKRIQLCGNYFIY